MSTIATLSSDCIALLLEYLSGNDIRSLLTSGDRVLRPKIVRNVKRIRNYDNFPFSALKLPHLQSLSVTCFKDCHLRFHEGDNPESIAPRTSNSRITTFRLEAANAAALFTLPGSLSLQERFPSLTDLHLECFATDRLVEAFSEFPSSTLTRLRISSVSSDHDLSIYSISRLPRSLLSLHLKWRHITCDAGADSKDGTFEGLFPPHLTTLELATISGYTVLDHLPQNLEHLTLFFHFGFNARKIAFSLLPPKLVSLETDLEIEFDSPINDNFTSFFLVARSIDELVSLQDITELFRAPPALPLAPPDFYASANGSYQRFNRIERCFISNKDDLELVAHTQMDEGYPKLLESRESHLRFLKPLPKSIKTLILTDSSHPDDIQMLPRQLEELTINPMLCNGQVPSWDLEHALLLPEYLRTLSIPCEVVDNPAKLAPISKFFLERLCLPYIPMKHFKSLPNWLPYCLPPHLKTLELSSSDNKLNPDAIRLCKLDETVPHLVSLTINTQLTNESSVGLLFASLPRNLQILDFQSLSIFEQGTMSFLPRHIEQMSLSFYDSSKCPLSVTESHFEGIPERLCSLTLQLPSRAHSLSEGVHLCFPKTLVSVSIRPDDLSTRKIQDEIFSFLKMEGLLEY